MIHIFYDKSIRYLVFCLEHWKIIYLFERLAINKHFDGFMWKCNKSKLTIEIHNSDENP